MTLTLILEPNTMLMLTYRTGSGARQTLRLWYQCITNGFQTYRLKEQGVAPPVDRDDTDFDPGAKYHVNADLQYIMYVVSGIVEFQLHKSVCIAAGQYDPNNSTSNHLYLCDIYEKPDAGNKLKSMMALGKSHVWPDALEKVTGQRVMDAQPLLDYFQPLYQWLVKENNRSNEYIGWKSKQKRCYKKGIPACRIQDSCRYS
ncbi:angiotensin-converting enzyme-like [Homalodisca vitripennis]|uniref:angiotensin-converting enzyme-like n=1 Tax=Homalodisca vitripennis TaxID=197043 RepID=UPI001EEC8A5C|nr:angiotensin-converting enzyme-like [Homalodisca vitripennis]